MGFWVGADPGGKGHFGLAFLDDESGDMCHELVSSVDDAVDEICRKGQPLGVGIDAPLWWSSGQASRRKADEWIRRHYSIHSGTVQSPNSLRGAALVGGMMLACRIREKYAKANRGVHITESHPKALLMALDLSRHAFAQKFHIEVPENEHKWDAAVAALCAREGFRGRWTNDLIENRHPSEQDPLEYWLAPVHYFWPEPERT